MDAEWARVSRRLHSDQDGVTDLRLPTQPRQIRPTVSGDGKCILVVGGCYVGGVGVNQHKLKWIATSCMHTSVVLNFHY